jgi:ABC-type multidrug transport system ATPase subunit
LLYHSARTRLPAYFSEGEIAEVVDVVMSHLGLKHLSNVIVGGEADSAGGLSAGDRKMVNIAIELVALPSVLFMDEPTSSIDASSAMNVASIAHDLARSGLTVVAVIHQPRGKT